MLLQLLFANASSVRLCALCYLSIWMCENTFGDYCSCWCGTAATRPIQRFLYAVFQFAARDTSMCPADKASWIARTRINLQMQIFTPLFSNKIRKQREFRSCAFACFLFILIFVPFSSCLFDLFLFIFTTEINIVE